MRNQFKCPFIILAMLLLTSNAHSDTIYFDGNLYSGGTQNKFEFYVSGSEPFSAYLQSVTFPDGSHDAWDGQPSSPGSRWIADTLFYLFDSSMRLVAWNDNSGSIPFTSYIQEDSLPQGNYFLIVSHYNFWPLDEQGVMFELPTYVAMQYEYDWFYQQHPISNLNGPLVGFAFLGHGVCYINSYVLAIEGASHVPEPASLLLLCTGLIGLAGYSRKWLSA